MSLILKIKRISPTHHTLEYKREDGTGEKKEFESKSVLIHDFIHYALESEAQLTTGFFGLLTQGYSFEELASKTPSDFPKEEGMEIEMIVGPLTSVVKGDATPAQLIESLDTIFASYGKSRPVWVTEELINRARERYKKILGAWNSLKFGETFELTWNIQ